MRDMSETPSKVQGILLCEMEDGFITYQGETDEVHFLNHTASCILELCDGRLTRSEIALALQEAWNLEAAPLLEVDRFLHELAQLKLVRF